MVEIRMSKPPLGYCPTCGAEGKVTSDEIGIAKANVPAGKCPVCGEPLKDSKAKCFVYKDDVESLEINISKNEMSQDLPENAQKFRDEVEAMQNLIDTMEISDRFEDKKAKRLKYANKLLSAAQLGLVFNDLNEGEKALVYLKDDMVTQNEGDIKEKYNTKALASACIIGAISAVVGILLFLFLKDSNIHPYFFVITGTMLGTLLRIYYWGLKFNFENLKKYTYNKMSPYWRFLIMGATGAVLLLLLKDSVIDIKFFDLDAQKVVAQISLQFCFGILVGILGDALIVTLVESIKKKYNSSVNKK